MAEAAHAAGALLMLVVLLPVVHCCCAVQVAVICGRNKKLLADLRSTKWPGGSHVVPCGFVDNIHEVSSTAAGIVMSRAHSLCDWLPPPPGVGSRFFLSQCGQKAKQGQDSAGADCMAVCAGCVCSGWRLWTPSSPRQAPAPSLRPSSAACPSCSTATCHAR